jgi:hypothetical protein
MIDLSIGIIGMHRSVRSLWSAGEATMVTQVSETQTGKPTSCVGPHMGYGSKKPDPHFGTAK